MKCYAFRIQPDVRTQKTARYAEYPSLREYKRCCADSPLVHFNECVNFHNFGGKIKGAIPFDGSQIPEGEEFCIVYLSSKANADVSEKCGEYDRIIGVQVGCRKVKKTIRKDVPDSLKKYLKQNGIDLYYDYVTSYENSFLLKNHIPNAFKILTRKSRSELPDIPCYFEITSRSDLINVLKAIDLNIHPSEKTTWRQICQSIPMPKFPLHYAAAKRPFESINGEIIDTKADRNYKGAELSSRVNRYERDATAKQDMILAYDSEIDLNNGLKCHVCGFDFQETYGDLGVSFIEAHHLIPLSELYKNYEFKPELDMIPLCSNCHAMIHKMKEPDYEELRDKYQKICHERNRPDLASKASRVIAASNPNYIPTHIRNLYEQYKIELKPEIKSNIIHEIHLLMREFPEQTLKKRSLKEIIKLFW